MTDDVLGMEHAQGERGRLRVSGQSTEDGSGTTLLVVHEADDSWTFQGLGVPGVRLCKAATVALAESILGRAR